MSRSKPTQRKSSKDVLGRLTRIQEIGGQQGEIENVDNRALENEADLTSVGDEWLRQQINHSSQLHYVRLSMLALLILLVLIWLASIPTLLLISGTRWKDFEISDTVLVVYIGATTVNVLGLLKIATRWLFADNTSSLETILASIKDLQK